MRIKFREIYFKKIQIVLFIGNNTFVCEEFELVCATEFSIECQICNLGQYTVVRENQFRGVVLLSSGK